MAKNTHWSVPARVDLARLDDEQVLDLFIDAFAENDLHARVTFGNLVETHPEKIGKVFFAVVRQAIMNPDQDSRSFAQQQIMHALKAPGAAAELVKVATAIAEGHTNCSATIISPHRRQSKFPTVERMI